MRAILLKLLGRSAVKQESCRSPKRESPACKAGRCLSYTCFCSIIVYADFSEDQYLGCSGACVYKHKLVQRYLENTFPEAAGRTEAGASMKLKQINFCLSVVRMIGTMTSHSFFRILLVRFPRDFPWSLGMGP